MSLDTAQTAFRAEPCTATARRYVTELFDYWSDDMIGKDTLRAGLLECAALLTDNRSDLGGYVSVIVRAA